MFLLNLFLIILSKTKFVSSQSSSASGGTGSTASASGGTGSTTSGSTIPSTTTDPWACGGGCVTDERALKSVVNIKLRGGGSCYGVAISTHDILTAGSCVSTFFFEDELCYKTEKANDYNVTIILTNGMLKSYAVQTVIVFENPVYLTGEGSLGIIRIKPDPMSHDVPDFGIGSDTTTEKSKVPSSVKPNVACLHYGPRVELGNKDAILATFPTQKDGSTVPTKNTKIDTFEKCVSRYGKMFSEESQIFTKERDHFKKYNITDLSKRFTLSDSAICSSIKSKENLNHGGPLFLNMGGNYLLAGIMEGPRGVKGETAIYTLATPYVGWILDNSDAEKCQVQLPDDVHPPPHPTQDTKFFMPCGMSRDKKKSGAGSFMVPTSLASILICFKFIKLFN